MKLTQVSAAATATANGVGISIVGLDDQGQVWLKVLGTVHGKDHESPWECLGAPEAPGDPRA